MEAWLDPRSPATAVPRSDLPATLNGVRFEAWQPPFQAAQWEELAKQTDFPEPYFSEVAGKTTTAGAVIIEPDGVVAEGAGRVEYGEEVEAAQDCSQGSIMADEWIWGLPLRGM